MQEDVPLPVVITAYSDKTHEYVRPNFAPLLRAPSRPMCCFTQRGERCWNSAMCFPIGSSDAQSIHSFGECPGLLKNVEYVLTALIGA